MIVAFRYAAVVAVASRGWHFRADAFIASPSLGTTRSSRNLVSPPCGQYSHGSSLLVGWVWSGSPCEASG